MHDVLPDGSLVERAREGDRAAFDELVRRHIASVYRMLHRLVGNHEDAEDLAQECFVRAWSALDLYRSEAPFEAWLRRVALHLARDHFRRSARRPARPASGPEALTEAAHREPGAELSRHELAARLAAAIGRLPERLRVALVLRAFEGLDYPDVARVTGVTPATARTHVMQARKRLLAWLAPWLGSARGEGER